MSTPSNDNILWDTGWGRIRDATTGGVLFQLSVRFASPALVQCDGFLLGARYKSREASILNLKDVVL